MNPSSSYQSIKRIGHPAVHCEAHTGRLRMGGQCWGAVALFEVRSPLHGRVAAPRCEGHRGAQYQPEPSSASVDRAAGVRLLEQLRCAESILLALGWSITQASVNVETGFVRLCIEARNWHERAGVQLLLHRSAHGGRVIMERSRVVLGHGFYEQQWEIAATLGRDVLEGDGALREAAEAALHYCCDNHAGGALPPRAGDRRREKLQRFLAGLRPAMTEGSPVALHSIEGEPLTPEWQAECERCCLGDGWEPYIPSVTAGTDCDRRQWVSASGTIVDGRGVHREGTYALGESITGPR